MLNIGFVGTGSFAMKHARYLATLDGIRLTGFVGTSIVKAAAAAESFPGTVGCSTTEELIARCKPDAVFICVPPYAHGPAELALIEHGIPFFCEKPIGIDLLTPSRIVSALHDKPVLTAVGYHFRYMDAADHLKQRLEGRQAAMAVGAWNGNRPAIAWWQDPKLSGGQMIEQTTHIIDLLRYMLGEATDVYAACASSTYGQPSEAGSITFTLASGAVAAITNTFVLPGRHFIGLQVMTEQGVLEAGQAGFKEYRDGSVVEHISNSRNPHEAGCLAFIHALRTGDTSLIRSTYEDAYRTQQLAVAASESAVSGKPVRIAH